MKEGLFPASLKLGKSVCVLMCLCEDRWIEGWSNNMRLALSMLPSLQTIPRKQTWRKGLSCSLSHAHTHFSLAATSTPIEILLCYHSVSVTFVTKLQPFNLFPSSQFKSTAAVASFLNEKLI